MDAAWRGEGARLHNLVAANTETDFSLSFHGQACVECGSNADLFSFLLCVTLSPFLFAVAARERVNEPWLDNREAYAKQRLN